ncbi:MAG: LacI family DNA-binding transcriptional regulator [Candidatus Promineifilaceae bacterium]|nr:LacI family DNA-binding transcriptional regulator [Candidatus Promineifilaceae bacterium]
MPTIRDVAKRAGVATMTVSRVINDSGYVSEATRAKVEEAITELGYVPNMLGPSLRFNQTNTLAIVLADITNPFWTTLARGVEDAAHENGYNVILCNTDESPEKQDQYLTMLLKRRIDGILLAPAGSRKESVDQIQKQGVSVVLIDRYVPDATVDIIRGDSVGGAYQVVQHLIQQGHRHIAVLAGPKDVSTASDRVTGYRQAIRDAKIEIGSEAIYWGNFTHDSGYSQTKQALTADQRPTAIFATNNFIATGALKALYEADLRVPDDISLAAFDDFLDNATYDPFLTVVTQPSYDMGYKATELLLDRLDGDGTEEYRHILLPTKLIVRRSSGPPPSQF